MSNTVLVVDDLPIIRNPVAATLAGAGYQTLRAADGLEALQILRAQSVDLVLLDVKMPVMDGLSLLRVLRRDASLANIPVIMLTGADDREDVLQAAKLGIKGYVLKSNLSLRDLVVRVTQFFAGFTEVSKPKVAPKLGSVVSADQTPSNGNSNERKPVVAETARGRVEIPALLDRARSLARAKQALHGKTLSGVVAEVISLADSPRGDAVTLAGLISRDPLLSARVLQVAHSSAYGGRGRLSTLSDAVRNIGVAAVRNIAAALGVFDAMPATDANGLNQLRCWQHSSAVAALCNRFANKRDSGFAYLIGLCHDLGDILFQSEFAEEYRQVLELEQLTGQPRDQLERAMLGISRGELLPTIITCLQLPKEIGDPILEYQSTGAAGRGGSPQTRLLRAADVYANGMLLACSNQSPIRPITIEEAKAITGMEDPPAPDGTLLRAEILSLTATLSRFSPKQQAEVMAAPYAKKSTRVWLARDESLSSLDPVAAALELLADVVTSTALPTAAEAVDYQAIVVMTPSATTPIFHSAELNNAIGPNGARLPILWLVGKADGGPHNIAPSRWPISLAELAEFIAMIN